MLKTITVSECKGNTYFLNTKYFGIKNFSGYVCDDVRY
nr:MAG TPA: hypothetical protein [Caudoviricetes sp.]